MWFHFGGVYLSKKKYYEAQIPQVEMISKVRESLSHTRGYQNEWNEPSFTELSTNRHKWNSKQGNKNEPLYYFEFVRNSHEVRRKKRHQVCAYMANFSCTISVDYIFKLTIHVVFRFDKLSPVPTW